MIDSEKKMDSTKEHEEDIVSNELAATEHYGQEVEDILEKLDPEEQSVIATMFSGPLPPPDILEGYTNIYPDAPDKIFGWVDEQQNHRHFLEKEQLKLENEQLKKDHSYRFVGLICGLIITSLFIICGFILILNDKEILGIIGIISPIIIPIISLFINRRKKESPNKENDKHESTKTTEESKP